MFGPSEKQLAPEKSLHGSMSRLTGYRIAQPQDNPGLRLCASESY